MTDEHQHFDQKSIRYVLGKHKEAKKLAMDCIGFANATGGVICLGIEDGDDLPQANQRIDTSMIEELRKRLAQITVNLKVDILKVVAKNGGEYIEIRIPRNRQNVASTSRGQFYIRVSDETRPVRGDELARLISDRDSFVWELQLVHGLSSKDYDQKKCDKFIKQIKASDRVTEFVKSKSVKELLEHYFLTIGKNMTQLGVLWIGKRADRANLPCSPVIQYIKYDEQERKVKKEQWNNYDMNPMEMISEVWSQVPEWKESYEIPSGLFRKSIPHYEEVVVREILANALVHRPYTQLGDIYINLYTDRVEVHNPGLLPIGVTPSNILHMSIKRNPHLAKLFYDLKLMEGEGSGYDRMYEVLLSSGKPIPEVKEGHDRVIVTIRKQIAKPEIVDFMTKVENSYQPSQKELITLGLIAQHTSLTAIELKRILCLEQTNDLKYWLGNLKEKWKLVRTKGKTKATEYFIDPEILHSLEFKGSTSLKGIEKHRLQALILEDLGIYPDSSIGDIHQRIGKEIPRRKVRDALTRLMKDKRVIPLGNKRGRKYRTKNLNR